MTTRNVKLAGGQVARAPGSKNNRASTLRKRCPKCKVLRKYDEPDTGHGGQLHPRRPSWGRHAGRTICGWCIARMTGAPVDVEVKRDPVTGRVDKDASLAERAAEKARRKQYDSPRFVPVQVNGALRGQVELRRKASESDARRAVESNEDIMTFLERRTEKKFLFVPGKVISITVS